MDFFGGEEREALGQVEAHLIAENAARACAGAVGAVNPLLHDKVKKIEILMFGALKHKSCKRVQIKFRDIFLRLVSSLSEVVLCRESDRRVFLLPR